MTWGAALRCVGIEQEEHCPHGFRASASTILNEAGRWSADAIERELQRKPGMSGAPAFRHDGHTQTVLGIAVSSFRGETSESEISEVNEDGQYLVSVD